MMSFSEPTAPRKAITADDQQQGRLFRKSKLLSKMASSVGMNARRIWQTGAAKPQQKQGAAPQPSRKRSSPNMFKLARLGSKSDVVPAAADDIPSTSLTSATMSCASSSCPLSEVLVKKSVRFAQVEIREYSVTLCDYPMAGPFPIGLDWEHTQERAIDIAEYEESRQETRTPMGARQLSDFERCRRIAQVSGKSPSDIMMEDEDRIMNRLLEDQQTAEWEEDDHDMEFRMDSNHSVDLIYDDHSDLDEECDWQLDDFAEEDW